MLGIRSNYTHHRAERVSKVRVEREHEFETRAERKFHFFYDTRIIDRNDEKFQAFHTEEKSIVVSLKIVSCSNIELIIT